MQIFTRTNKPPPPIPWTTRADINMAMLYASPATKLPTRNTTFAISSTGLRPKMSDIFPHIGVDAAAPSKYPEPIQVYPAGDWKCSAMDGSAVVIIV